MQNPTQSCPQCHSPIPADAPGGLCPGCVLLGVAGPTNPSQTFTANTPTIEEVAAAFPELEVLELLGQGGMGVVFKARQPRIDRLVALKILPPALAAQPGFAERFTREARVLARLAHPHIVAIYDFGESAGFFYLIMEFVNGVNLRAAMRAGVTPEQALLLVPHICEALQFAHDHGVLHRDIKPENILLDTAGAPKLADFGIAKLAGETSVVTGLTATGAALGTAAYMAPEQVEKPATVDHRADIYSLGVVFYEMLTGELPLGRFAAPSAKSSVNRGVDEVVMRALEKERERRQQSATAMKTEVEQATMHGEPVGGVASSTEDAEPLWSRIFGALTALSAVGIPVVAMLGWDTPNPVHMVALTIVFGTLAGVANSFSPETKTLPSQVRRHREGVRTGRKVAVTGIALLLTCVVTFALVVAWVSEFRTNSLNVRGFIPREVEMFQQHPVAFSVIGCVVVGAGLGGVIALVTSLVGYRYRSPWFFWCVILTTLGIAITIGNLGGDAFATFALLFGTAGIGYCLYHFREFFPLDASPEPSADVAWNPWPRRIFFAMLAIVLVPVLAWSIMILAPRLTVKAGRDARAADRHTIAELESPARKAAVAKLVLAEKCAKLAREALQSGTGTATEADDAQRALAAARREFENALQQRAEP